MIVQESPASRARGDGVAELLLGVAEGAAGGEDPTKVLGVAGRGLGG